MGAKQGEGEGAGKVHKMRETSVARHSPLKVIRRHDGLVCKGQLEQ